MKSDTDTINEYRLAIQKAYNALALVETILDDHECRGDSFSDDLFVSDTYDARKDLQESLDCLSE